MQICTCSGGFDDFGFAASSVPFGGVRCHSNGVGRLREQPGDDGLLLSRKSIRPTKKQDPQALKTPVTACTPPSSSNRTNHTHKGNTLFHTRLDLKPSDFSV